jgi:predicted AlkP superfamily pyrophosphatase or phosphodiesterase
MLSSYFKYIIVLSLVLASTQHPPDANAQTRPNIKLVLQITIDGLRADLLNRYDKGFGKDHLRYLTRKGTVYTNAHSPWRYGTHVPIIFVGPGINSQMVHRRVHPADVAPTIVALLGMSPPGSAQGAPVEEVLR